MALKIEVEELVPATDFPKLMISELGQIVLAYGLNHNDKSLMRIVVLDHGGYPISGEDCYYTENFMAKLLRDYHGSVTISNY